MMYRRFNITDGNTAEALTGALEFIHDNTVSMQTELMCEEGLTKLIAHGNFSGNAFIQVNIRRLFGNVKIDLTVPGNEFDFAESLESIMQIKSESTEAISNIILRSFRDRISYRHSRNFNTITIHAVQSPYYGLYQTLAAVTLAIISGLTLRIFFPSAGQTLNNTVLLSLRDVFMNGLNMCAVPVVFFSIASCVANFGNMSGMRRTGAILTVAFIASSVVSVFVGFAILFPFRPGIELTKYLSTSSTSTAVSLTLREMITGVVPSNIVMPFLNANMLQIIIIALLVGISAGRTGSKNFMAVIEEGNNVFMNIMGIIAHMVPLIIFCSTASLIITTGISVMSSVISIFFLLLSSYIVLFVLQIISVFVIGRLNPFVMLRKSMPMIVTAFTTCSSTAALTDSMKAAESLGISPKLNSFAIPLGTAVNKNGFCVFLAVYTMLAANVYGISMPVPKMITLAFTTIALVAAAPGVPGAGLAVITTLFAQLGSPLEIFTLAMAINPVLDTIDTATTCTGNLVATLITARHENLIDMRKYYE